MPEGEFKDGKDAFGKPIADSVKNDADIAAHYPFNPERHRLFLNGNRQFVQYNSISKFNQLEDAHELQPASNDSMVFRTAEKFRYRVQYVVKPSIAFEANQSLQSGDKVAFEYGDDTDGWAMEWRGDLASDEVELFVRRNGTTKASRVVKTNTTVTDWNRYAAEINWYNVGEARFIETYTDDADNQNNELLDDIAVKNERGPQSGNKRIRLRVEAGSSTSDLKVRAGSMGMVTLGDVGGINRPKTHQESGLTHDGDGNWQALAAMRVDPNNPNVTVNIDNVDPVSGPTGKLMMIAVDPSKTDASSWGTPEEHNSQNTAIQTTTSVSTFPDSSGSTGSDISNPGGYQLAFASTEASSNEKSVETGARTKKRQLHDTDVGVIVAKSSSNSDYKIDITAIQEW